MYLSTLSLLAALEKTTTKTTTTAFTGIVCIRTIALLFCTNKEKILLTNNQGTLTFFIHHISHVLIFCIFACLTFLTKKEDICPFTCCNSTVWLSNLKSSIFFKTNKQTKINKSFYSSYKLGRNVFPVWCKQVNKVYLCSASFT